MHRSKNDAAHGALGLVTSVLAGSRVEKTLREVLNGIQVPVRFESREINYSLKDVSFGLLHLNKGD